MIWEVGPTDDETMRRRRMLAQAIQEDLAVAGLPVVAPVHGHLNHAGAHVTMDAVHDEHGGGVYVDWEPHYVLRTAASTAVFGGLGTNHPAAEHNGATARAMQNAIAEILTAAGYTVAKDHNSDYAPFQIKVLDHTPPSPSWRDWLHARQDELTETMRATHRREHPEA